MADDSSTIEVAYSKKDRRIDVLVPKGTSITEIAKIQDRIFAEDIIGRLPRGCMACLSGDNLSIRDKIGPRVRVDLKAAKGLRLDVDRLEVIEELGGR